jgi:hypothetical protein
MARMGDGRGRPVGLWCGLGLGCWCVPERVRLEDEGLNVGFCRI